jgi:hypothetical protein
MYKKYKVGKHNYNILKTGDIKTNKESDMTQIPVIRVKKFFYIRK